MEICKPIKIDQEVTEVTKDNEEINISINSISC